MYRLQFCATLLCWPALGGLVSAQEKVLKITTPMSPPAWALLERQVLDASSDACREFFHKYFDDRGWLLCVERWGGDDGPDDAIENCNDWPILHALGGSDDVRQITRKPGKAICASTRSRRRRTSRSPRTACTTKSSR
jgi:hypothetical protein